MMVALMAKLHKLDLKLIYNKRPYGRVLIGYSPGTLQNEAAAVVNADREERGVAEFLPTNNRSMFIVQVPRDYGGHSFDWARSEEEFCALLQREDVGEVTPEQQALLEEIIKHAKENP